MMALNEPLIPKDVDEEFVGSLYFLGRFGYRYGENTPFFFPGLLEDAVNKAYMKPAKERRLLGIYLHHDDSVFANEFCMNLLHLETALHIFNNHFVIWGWDLTNNKHKHMFFTSALKNLGNLIADTVKNITVTDLPVLLIVIRSLTNTVLLNVVKGNINILELTALLSNAVDIHSQIIETELKEEEQWQVIEIIDDELPVIQIHEDDLPVIQINEDDLPVIQKNVDELLETEMEQENNFREIKIKEDEFLETEVKEEDDLHVIEIEDELQVIEIREDELLETEVEEDKSREIGIKEVELQVIEMKEDNAFRKTKIKEEGQLREIKIKKENELLENEEDELRAPSMLRRIIKPEQAFEQSLKKTRTKKKLKHKDN